MEKNIFIYEQQLHLENLFESHIKRDIKFYIDLVLFVIE